MEEQPRLSNLTISKHLLLEHAEVYEPIERDIRARLTDDLSDIVREELLGLLVIAILKQSIVETGNLRNTTESYFRLVLQIERDLRRGWKQNRKKRSHLLMYQTFLNIASTRLYYIEFLYGRINQTNQSDRARVMRKDFELRNATSDGRYLRQITLLFQKYMTHYGTSFGYLFFSMIAQVLIFAGIFFINDALKVTGFVISGRVVESFDYYAYMSLITFSNLQLRSSVTVRRVRLTTLLAARTNLIVFERFRKFCRHSRGVFAAPFLVHRTTGYGLTTVLAARTNLIVFERFRRFCRKKL